MIILTTGDIMILPDGTYMNTNEYNKTKGWYADNDKPHKITWLDVFAVVHAIAMFPFCAWFIYNYY